jgi:hypothetical protein
MPLANLPPQAKITEKRAAKVNKRAPVRLGKAGRGLWRDHQVVAIVRPGAEAVLVQACRLADEITALEGALANGSLAVPAYPAGSVKVNPLVGELRAHRLALAKLLTQFAAITAAARDAAGGAPVREAGVPTVAQLTMSRLRAEVEARNLMGDVYRADHTDSA